MHPAPKPPPKPTPNAPWQRLAVATPLALALSLQLGWKAEARAISEARYSDGMAEKVAPFVRAQMHAGVFAGQRQVAIHYRSFACPGAGATVVVLTGYSESARKYDELAYDLCQAGFASVAMDHRGQGESGRLNKSPPMAAIDNFDFLVDDLESLLERAVPADRPRYLVAHSMGATVAALYLQRHPGAFRGAALSAPMLAINLEGRGEFLTKAKLLALAAWGGFDSYLPGRGPDVPGHQAFARNAVTYSRARFEASESLVRRNPALAIGEQSVGWLYRALQGSAEARARASAATDPILLLQAGDDELVMPAAQDEFCARAPHCRLLRFPGARHEILQERDSIREPALREIFQFFKQNRRA